MISVVDYAMSIGPNCRAKHQLLRRYGALAVGGVFDWQITPLATIEAYLANDFVGFFELADLVLRDRYVRNDRYGTMHQHEFPTGLTSQDQVAEWYEQARARHDHVCDTTRRVLRSRRRVLLAMSGSPDPEAREALQLAFRTYASPSTELYFTYEPAPPERSLGWEGDFTMWDAMLDPYPGNVVRRIGMRLRSMIRQHHRRPPRLNA